MTRLLLLAIDRGCEVTFAPGTDGWVDVTVAVDDKETTATISAADCDGLDSQELEITVGNSLVRVGAATQGEVAAAIIG